MKRYLILLASAAIVALAACNKEPLENPVNDGNIVLTFTSERPQTDVATKTAWDGSSSSVVWTSEDKIRVGYTLDGVWMAENGPAVIDPDSETPAKFYTSSKVTIDETAAQIGTFSVPTDFKNKPSGSAIFYGVYPSTSTALNSNYAPSLSVTIPTIQALRTNTFDAAADLMIGKSESIALEGSFPSTPVSLDWNRVVAHADITFSNLQIEDDNSVNKITLTFNSEAKVTGSYYVDVTTGEVTTNNGSKNEIILSGSNLSISSGSIEVWCCLLPVTFSSLDVEIKTDVATYTRSISGLSLTFKKNARNTLTVNMANAARAENTEIVADGNYVIAAKSGDTYYAISKNQNGTSERRDRVALVASFDPAAYSASAPYTADNDIIWTISNVSGGVKINFAGDTSQYMKYGDNKLPLGAEGATFELTKDNDLFVFSTNGRYISMNNTYGFGCYASSNSYIRDLYLIPASGTPDISFAVTDKTVSASTTSVEFGYTASFLTDAPTATVTTDNGNAVSSTSVNTGENKILVTLNPNETTSDKLIKLTVSATGVATPATLTITQKGAVSYSNQWVLVTSVSELAVDDKIVIVNTQGTKALGTTQNDNNRAAVDVLLHSNDDHIVVINDQVQQITLGQNNGHWTFYTGSGYLYAASSSSNYLRTQTTNNANGEWTIELNSSNEATITAQGSNTRNLLKNNGEVFACYASGQTAVKIYKFHADPYAPVLSVSPVYYTWPSNNDDTQTFTVTAANGTWAIDDSAVSSWATVTQTANGFTVKPISKQATEDHVGTLKITLTPSNTGYSPLSSGVILVQEKYSASTTYTYTFTSNSWAATLGDSAADWISGKDGYQMQSGRGVQITTKVTGANATSPNTFTNVSKIAITYSTNASAGEGSIAVQVGSNTAVSKDVTKTGGTTDRTLEYTFDPKQSGEVKFTVSCSTNSIYVKSIAITAD